MITTASTFDTAIHRNMLFRILKDIYSDTTLAQLLALKGGTAALLFYGLSRFSVDLDFDLLDKDQEDYAFDRMTQIAKNHGLIKTMARKRFVLSFALSYKENARNIKIEISRRPSISRYELKTYLGVSMLAMVQEDMFAHKLMAMYERVGRTSRDIYDVWFFLEKLWPINETIIEQRADMSFHELLQKCINKLEKMNNRDILSGLGDLLTDSQKNWAREKLRTDTIFLLKARLESEK